VFRTNLRREQVDHGLDARRLLGFRSVSGDRLELPCVAAACRLLADFTRRLRGVAADHQRVRVSRPVLAVPFHPAETARVLEVLAVPVEQALCVAEVGELVYAEDGLRRTVLILLLLLLERGSEFFRRESGDGKNVVSFFIFPGYPVERVFTRVQAEFSGVDQ
jgi:hypothetical protein